MECRLTTIPMEEGIQPHNDMNSKCINQTEYQSLVGSLIFLTNTKTKIAFVVSSVSHCMTIPQQAHMDATKKSYDTLKEQSI